MSATSSTATSAAAGGEQYFERWKQLDAQIVKLRGDVRTVDMALTVCHKARECDNSDVAQARFALESQRRAKTAELTKVAADAALMLLLRRIDPTHELPPTRALAVLRGVGPARCPQTVRVCKEIRVKCREAYNTTGDTRSVGWEGAALALEEAAVSAFLDTEESGMVFISMLEPCIASAVAFSEDPEVAKRAAEIDMFQDTPPTLNEEDDVAKA